TLANKPELIRRWCHGGNPYGQAVISAGVDARRCGHPEPIPRPVIEALAEGYLTPKERAKADPKQWLDQALAWACTPIRGDSAPMNPIAATIGTIDGYQISDMLLDHANTDPAIGAVPDSTWQVVIDTATDLNALFQISVVAYTSGKLAQAQ